MQKGEYFVNMGMILIFKEGVLDRKAKMNIVKLNTPTQASKLKDVLKLFLG